MAKPSAVGGSAHGTLPRMADLETRVLDLQSVARVLLPLTMLALFGPGCAGRASCTDCCTNTIGCADLEELGVAPTGGCDAVLSGRSGSCEDFCRQLQALGAFPPRTFVACEFTSKDSGPAIACSYSGLCLLDAGQ
jgi:hypothetical protein